MLSVLEFGLTTLERQKMITNSLIGQDIIFIGHETPQFFGPGAGTTFLTINSKYKILLVDEQYEDVQINNDYGVITWINKNSFMTIAEYRNFKINSLYD